MKYARSLASLAALGLVLFPCIGFAAVLKDEVATLAHGSLSEKRLLTPGTDAPLRVVAEAGGAQSDGNTDTTHFSGDLRMAVVPFHNWVFEGRGRLLYERSEEKTTANSWGLFGRVDRYLTTDFGIFTGLGIERNAFAGLGRRLSSQLGATYLAIDHRDPEKEDLVINRLRLEVGGYAAWEAYTLSPTAAPDAVLSRTKNHIFALRGAVGYIHALTRNTNAGLEVEVIQDFVDINHVFVNSTAYIAVAIFEGFALKIAGTHIYNSVPPETTLKKSDFLTTGNIVVSL